MALKTKELQELNAMIDELEAKIKAQDKATQVLINQLKEQETLILAIKGYMGVDNFRGMLDIYGD